MMTIEAEAIARKARQARYRRDMSELDYRRNVVRLKKKGVTQVVIADYLGVTQPTVQGILKKAAGEPMPPQGFSGANPLEICERYAAGMIKRAQLIDELGRWEYAPRARTADPLDDLIVNERGSMADLDSALYAGLIDDDIYDEVGKRIETRLRAA